MKLSIMMVCALAAGCGTSDVDPCSGVKGSCVAVQIDGASSIKLDAIAFHVVGQGIDASKSTAPAGGHTISPPFAAALVFDSLPGGAGSIELTVSAEASLAAAPVASGVAPAAQIVAGKHSTIHLALHAGGASVDLGVSSDLGGSRDLAGNQNPSDGSADLAKSAGFDLGDAAVLSDLATATQQDLVTVPYTPIHIQASSVIAGAPDLVLSANPSTIVTTGPSPTINGATSPYFVMETTGGHTYAVLSTNAFSVQNHLIITGTAPLVVAARDTITVSATIDLIANLTTAGPGAVTGGVGAGGTGSSYNPGDVRSSSGGGGASFGTIGGAGGDESASAPAGGSGTRYGDQLSDPLTGGSSGGPGGSAGTGPAGGAGGGALQLSSAVSVTITSTGTINAGGGGGKGGGTGTNGGGGGGSGGEIFCEAPTISISNGTLLANGGGGGGGGANGGGGPGGDGNNANPGPGPATGGVAGVPQGAPGGAGSGTDGTGALIQATNGTGSSFASKAGGGGGGGGRIWLRYRAATPPTITGTRVSPPATLDSTLP